MATAVESLEEPRGLFFDIFGSFDASAVTPRLGRLRVKGRQELETPNFFAITSRGVVPHLTPDVISASTTIGGVHMALEDFIERATIGTPPIMSCPGSSPLHTFTALPRPLITLLAPRRTPAVSAPKGNSDTAISVFPSTGFQVLSNKSYISYIAKLHPDIAISLADVPHGSIPGSKRVAKMGDRTQEWVTELLTSKNDEQAVFAPILPIDFLSQYEYLNQLADELTDGISGLAFYDSNLLPDMPATTSLSRLPRLSLDEPSSPRQILRQVSLGMDIFTVPFIGFATEAGIALTFRFPRPVHDEPLVSDGIGSSVLPLGITMSSNAHAASLRPLSPACACYTCTNHHRAFVQHLLSADEMLSWTLLQIHNSHVVSEFFTSIRMSIRSGNFGVDCDEFARLYESDLPENSGQGPRVRGYHSKSEGPGELKRNKAAWGNLGNFEHGTNGLIPAEPAGTLEDKGFAEKTDT
ncbi:Queuine tRNA-ribosyltransferase accessory subunit [Lachnellula subtilissima]|uniref:Queuine tRNA-ribosyltransferase accessory subunit 2 n=1 Tax=Lachnellula subtilissima TaxID=602034 RepID=A0A8H8RY77_9HELO|nr:Queuine tRNA-ribosyltransferase accessory subunit [Lachnellula subtilissima]